MTASAPEYTLASLPTHTTAVVREVGGARSVALRLMELGLLPGTTVSLRRRAPMGDPLELRLRGYSLTIRLSEARGILVEELQGTRDGEARRGPEYSSAQREAAE